MESNLVNYRLLKEALIKASEAYYKDNDPIMSDYEFDIKLKELEKMEEELGFKDPDSPTVKPGSDLTTDDYENAHKRPMLSLENTYNYEEVEKWYEDMKKITGDENLSVIVNPKWDGNSGALRYKNGYIYKALTRGSGLIGENITQNVKYCDDNCWTLKRSQLGLYFNGEVRGELIMTDDGFAEINSDGKYQNARNLVSGSLKLLNIYDFIPRANHIQFYAYWLEESNNQTYEGDLKELSSFGFTVGDYYLCNNIDEIKDAIDKIEIANYPVTIDGAVMKVNEKKYWNLIGSTAKYPRWAKAYKYKQESVETVVTDITFQVGRTGKVTPLCWFEPKFIDGSTVQKATLNNKEFYDAMDIAVGDVIEVQKAAAIIPQIISVNERPSDRVKIDFPTTCPDCGSILVKHNEDHADLYCDNDDCQARIIDKIINYTHAIEADGFGEENVIKLYDAGLLKSIEDLYDLKNHKDEISKLDRLSDKLANKLCKNIEDSKECEFWKTLTGLGIPNVGSKMAKTLAEHFKNIQNLMNANVEKLMDIENVAEITAKCIYNYFQNHKTLINRLIKENVNLVDTTTKTINSAIKDKAFCITGALSLARSYYENLIEVAGGKNVSAVSNKTDYLVTNDANSNSSKNLKAAELGIPVINEEELKKMLGLKS